MIEIKTQKGETDLTALDGGVTELAVDALVILNAIYETILEETNPYVAERFARYVKSGINSNRGTPFRTISDRND